MKQQYIKEKEDVMKYPSPFEIDDDDINVKNGDRVSYSIAPKLKESIDNINKIILLKIK